MEHFALQMFVEVVINLSHISIISGTCVHACMVKYTNAVRFTWTLPVSLEVVIKDIPIEVM